MTVPHVLCEVIRSIEFFPTTLAKLVNFCQMLDSICPIRGIICNSIASKTAHVWVSFMSNEGSLVPCNGRTRPGLLPLVYRRLVTFSVIVVLKASVAVLAVEALLLHCVQLFRWNEWDLPLDKGQGDPLQHFASIVYSDLDRLRCHMLLTHLHASCIMSTVFGDHWTEVGSEDMEEGRQ